MTLLQNARHIVIEGPTCVGKTSLAQRLALYFGQSRHTELLLDSAQTLPVMEHYYQDPGRYAFSTQLTLLFQRMDKTEALKQRAQQHVIISDFMMERTNLFSQFVLSESDLLLWQRVYNTLRPQASTPDLVLYIYADIEQMMVRINQLQQEILRSMPKDYVVKMLEAYHQFFHGYTNAPLMSVNVGAFDFGQDETAFKLLVEQIAGMRGTREFFNPNF